MATASVIEKSLSPSPVATAAAVAGSPGANCPCKSCLSTVQIATIGSGQQIDRVLATAAKDGEIVERKFASDLEQIAYSIVMLVMEGRTPIEPIDQSTTPTDDQPRVKRVAATIKEGHHSKQLSERLMHKILNLNSSGGRSGGSMMTTTTTSIGQTTGHSCSARNQQCRIAFKLREKIRKCLRYHHGKQLQGERILSKPTPPVRLVKQAICDAASNHPIDADDDDDVGTEVKTSQPVEEEELEEQAKGEEEEEEEEEDVEIEDNLDGLLVVIDNLSSSTAVVSEPLRTVKTVIQIEVYLLANCCFNELVCKTGDNLILDSSATQQAYSYELLERWNISMITNKNNSNGSDNNNNNSPKSLLSLNELFQAIRSYLYFSQLSSWINQTKGQHPKNIAFSVSYLDEGPQHEPPPPVDKLAVDQQQQQLDQSSATTLKESKTAARLDSADYDFQTFPNISLTFLNNNLCLINKDKNNSNKNSSSSSPSITTTRLPYSATGGKSSSSADSTSLTSTSLIVNLFSRKRRNSPPVVISDQQDPTGSLGLIVPQIACARLHQSGYFGGGGQTASRIAELRMAMLNSSVAASKATSPTDNAAAGGFMSKIFAIKRNSIDEHDKPTTSSPPPASACSSQGQSIPTTINGSGRQHYYLPHWSTIMTTPPPSMIGGERRRSSVEANDLTTGKSNPISLASSPSTPRTSGGNESILAELLKQQQNYYGGGGVDEMMKASQMVSSAMQTPSPTPVSVASVAIATPPPQAPLVACRPFVASSSNSENLNIEQTFPHAGDPTTGQSPLDNSSSSSSLMFMFGQSPKVLVSNHQLMMVDLCTTTQNQLKLSDLNNNLNLSKPGSSAPASDDPSDDKCSSVTPATTTETVNQNKRKFQAIVSNPGSGFDQAATTLSTTQTAYTENTQSKKQLTLQQPTTGEFSSNQAANSGGQAVVDELLRNKQARKELARLEASFSQSTQYEEPTILSNSSCSSASDVNNNVKEMCSSPPSQSQSGGGVKPPPLKLTTRSCNMMKRASNFPLSSSPAPVRKSGTSLFGFDSTLKDPRSIKNALAVNLLSSNGNDDNGESAAPATETSVASDSTSAMTVAATTNCELSKRRHYAAPNQDYKQQHQQLAGFSNSLNLGAFALTPSCLLGSFEESLLNGRMNPVGIVDGFYAEIGASGSFFPEHATLPVNASFYQVCEDVAASPYLGVINLASLGKRGYKVPNKGTIQVTLFNPNNTVVKMFVVMYDLSDMPPSHRTFLRQRTMYVPLVSSKSTKTVTNGNGSSSTHARKMSGQAKKSGQSHRSTSGTGANNKPAGGVCELEEEEDVIELKSYLRYLIHLRFATSKSGKMYLHTNVKLIFARNKCEIDPRLARYEYKTFTEAPKNPKYSPKK